MNSLIQPIMFIGLVFYLVFFLHLQPLKFALTLVVILAMMTLAYIQGVHGD